jgi:hypothetical protein
VLIEEGIRDAWFAFRDQAFEQIAEEFLVEAKIPFKREPESRERADVGPLAGRRKLAIVGEIRSLADRLAGSKSIDPIAGANRCGS